MLAPIGLVERVVVGPDPAVAQLSSGLDGLLVAEDVAHKTPLLLAVAGAVLPRAVRSPE